MRIAILAVKNCVVYILFWKYAKIPMTSVKLIIINFCKELTNPKSHIIT